MDNRKILSRFDSIAWALLDTKTDAVTLVDLNGTILFLNDSTAQRFDKSPEEIIGNCIWVIYSRTWRSRHLTLTIYKDQKNKYHQHFLTLT